MATPADQRLLALLDKWIKSLELHTRYAALDDGSYSTIQPWPPHQRPSRWIIDLAMQKAVRLRTLVAEHLARGDAEFADGLELMGFLANLVGSQHIERFIPLAEPESEAKSRSEPEPAVSTKPGKPTVPADGETREMPAMAPEKPRAPAPPGTATAARAERRATVAAAPPVLSARFSPGASPAVRDQVIADAVRLVQWGRKWYELAELISAMADRPALTDVRRILKDNKTAIDEKAGRR